MGLTYEIRDGRYAAATGYEGKCSILRIPAVVERERERFPVREIGRHAFEKREELREAIVPESVEQLSAFAFFHCTRLARLSLTDRVTEYQDGVIRQCSALQRIEIRFFQAGNFRILKELLQDNDRRLRFRLLLPDGKAELAFPAYLDGFSEDTMARAIHARIEGSGYTYRQTVSRKEIDFHGYDRLFSRAAYDDPRTALSIALGRLRCPYRLAEQARADYSAYLREQNAEALRLLLEDRDMEGIRFLADSAGLSDAALRDALPFCAERKDLEATAFLMEYQRNHRRQKSAFTFSL